MSTLPAEKLEPRFQWCCNVRGCGPCEVKRIDFEYERTETMAGELLASKTIPRLVSVCCNEAVYMRDNQTGEEVDVACEPLPLPAESGAVGEVVDARLQLPAEILAIIERLHTQDNRCTQTPMFAVQQKRVIGGMDHGYEDRWVWVNGDSEEIHDEEEIQRLDALHESGSTPLTARRVGCLDTWEFVTGCFTEQGCKDYIQWDGHNLNEPRIYAYGTYRNREFGVLRDWLMSLRPAPASDASANSPAPAPTVDGKAASASSPSNEQTRTSS
jgi:hypothetical protein